jgi:serine phosphatase RsbU (regulator of sigma subunit)
MLYRNYREKKKINKMLVEKNEEVLTQQEEILKKNEVIESALTQLKKKNDDITSSINYAQRIQYAMLPHYEEIKRVLPKSFILFKPRDIVSGDFYWFVEANYKNKDFTNILGQKIIITAADCTGHGVPGALMSMIGNELLNIIVLQQKITEADQILNELHEGIRYALHQEATLNQDGMDIALCVIDKENKLVEYAGAKNPLIYVQKNEVVQIKGDKMPIGGRQIEEKREFTKHSIPISSPTTFYLFSDGYQDQIGGVNEKKFMIKNFRELLQQIHLNPFEEQKTILDDTFENWKGQMFQLDDVLVIGFSVE